MKQDNELFELLPIKGGLSAKVDRVTFRNALVLSWSLTADGYPATNYDGKRLYLHDFVMGNKERGDIIDHINGDKLDNRTANLRIVTKQQNNMNREANKVRKDTHYKGVILHSSGRWTARIGIDRKKMHLGYFDTPEEAAQAYNEAALKYHGEYARLNDLDKELAELKYSVEEATGWDLKQPDLTSYLLEKLPRSWWHETLQDATYRNLLHTGGIGGNWVASYKTMGNDEDIEGLTGFADTPLKALLKLTIALHQVGELTNIKGEKDEL